MPTPTRLPTGIALAVVFLVFAAALTATALTHGGWWNAAWPAVAFFFLFGVFGLARDVPKRPRDDNGKPIRKSS